MSHIHSVVDADKHFIINPITRAVSNSTETKNTLFQYDHNSERFTFEMPRTIDGHDMTECNSIQIHYVNIDAKTKATYEGLYNVGDVDVSENDPELITFSWLISRNATQFVGSLNFIVRFACVSEQGTLDYVWNTAIHSGVYIASSINNTEDIEYGYADILADWTCRITALEQGGGSGSGITVDAELSDTSVNPVQNKVINSALSKKVDISLVSDDPLTTDQIPTAGAMTFYISDYLYHFGVSTLSNQRLDTKAKALARSNIDAVSQAELAGGLDGKVDTSLVVSNIISDGTLLRDNIPNGSALSAFVREHGVSSTQVQSLTLDRKARARRNIDVDGGKWELLYTIEGDGETSLWEYTQFADGSPLKLTAVSAVIIQNVAEAEKSYGHLYSYCDEKSTQFPAAIYSYFTTNSAPTTPGTQRAYGVVEQYKGQYRAYSVGMAQKGNETMRYTPYMQGNSTTSDHPYIDHIKIQKQTGVFSVGNKIEVYGVRCYDEI